MKLKKYLDFINENIIEELDFLKQHKYQSDAVFYDAFIDLIDNGYKVTLEDRGLSFPDKYWDDSYIRKIKKTSFTNILLYGGENVHLAYKILIIANDKNKKDLTNEFNFICNSIIENAGLNISISNNSYWNYNSLNFEDIKDIKIKDKFYINGKELNDISLIISEKEPFQISIEDFIEFYEWTNVQIIDNKMYCDIERVDLASNLLGNNDYYKKFLDTEDGYNELWDDIDYEYNVEDLESDIEYNINDSNIRLIYEKIQKELGEDEFNQLLEEYDIEGDPIDYIMKNDPENFIKLFEDCDIVIEIKQTLRILYNDDIVSSYYDAIESNFEKSIKKYISEDYTKIEKNDKIYYRFLYSNDWIVDLKLDNIIGDSIESIFINFINDSCSGCKLDYIGDIYPSPSKEDINNEIESILK
ncbi:MAG: hypothetical protein M0R46_06970 [Candidatus Muirbacterium halophilum]|nr:hypothetical protein [Candidatus Muirbacterium halophilum]